jgi:hypothetical protein
MTILGQCSECCTCPTAVAEILPAVTISASFVSYTSAAPAVYGFSCYDDGSYDSEHPELWAHRLQKYKTRSNSGTIDRKDGKCVDPSFPTALYNRIRWDVTGSDTVDCSGVSSTTETKRYDQDYPTDSGTCNAPSVLVATYTGIAGFPTDTDHFNVTTNYQSRTINGNETIPTGDSSAYYGSVVSALSIRIGIQEAIICDSGATVGTLSCARTGYLQGYTTPESDEPISYGTSTSVVQSFDITGDPSTTYLIRITYGNRQADAVDETNPTPVFYDMPDTYDLVDVTTDAYGNASFDLSIPDDGTANAIRCFKSAELDSGDSYYIRFPVPKVGTGTCLRASWIERVVSSPVALDSVEVYARGCYRPTVTLSAPPSGGTQAYALAVMASDGSVSGISVINPGVSYIPRITISGGGGSGAFARAVIDSAGAVTSVVILSGGKGYASPPTVSFTDVSAPRVRALGTAVIVDGVVTDITIDDAGDFRPTVTIEPSIGGTSSATGWLAALSSDGAVSGITGGTGGDYLPSILISHPLGGTGGEVTCTMDAVGGIDAVTVVDGGLNDEEPFFTITGKIGSHVTPADLIPHFGTETAKCEAWDGVTPSGYDPDDQTTWPAFGPFTPDAGAKVRSIRTVCDCSECP